MIEVTLTAAEMQHALQVGGQRHIEALEQSLPDRHGARKAKDGWGLHIEGACGELAFARAVDRYWAGPVNNFKEADVGDRIQVRTRGHSQADLIVREDDADDQAFVLVTGKAPTFQVHGWIWGRTAKNPGWWHNHGGHGWAYFVPRVFLRQIDARARERAAAA